MGKCRVTPYFLYSDSITLSFAFVAVFIFLLILFFAEFFKEQFQLKKYCNKFKVETMGELKIHQGKRTRPSHNAKAQCQDLYLPQSVKYLYLRKCPCQLILVLQDISHESAGWLRLPNPPSNVLIFKNVR